jgi:hypothetical protein
VPLGDGLSQTGYSLPELPSDDEEEDPIFILDAQGDADLSVLGADEEVLVMIICIDDEPELPDMGYMGIEQY